MTLKEKEPKLDGPLSAELRKALSVIGGKLAPDMTKDQASIWKGAVVVSLSCWPGEIAIEAANRAMREPFPFGIRTVDARLHEHAKLLSGLRALEANPVKRLEPPRPALPAPELTDSEIEAMDRKMLRLGIGCGALDPERVRRVKAESRKS